jgi:hypothetical protein
MTKMSEGQYALGTLTLFALWLFVGLPILTAPAEVVIYRDAPYQIVAQSNTANGTQQAPYYVQVLPEQKDAQRLTQEAQDREEKKSADWWLVRWTAALFAATVGLIFATFVLGYFAWRQQRDARVTIAAAQKSAEAAERSALVAERALRDLERPWVFLAGVTVRRASPPDIPNAWFVKLHWENVGRTPGLTEECVCQITPKEGLPETPAYNSQYQLILPRTVAAGKTVETNEVGPGERKDTQLVVFGRLTYSELNGNKHQTGFAIEVSPHIAAYVPFAGEKYTYHT